MKLYELIKKSYEEDDNKELFKEIILKAYENKCYETAMIYMEASIEYIEADEEWLKTIIEIYSKLKKYDEIIKNAKLYLSKFGCETKIIHEYFKAIDKSDEYINNDDIEYLYYLSENDKLNSSERRLIVSYNKEYNDQKLWDIYTKSKEAVKSGKNFAPQGEKIYSDDRWMVYLIYRNEYIPSQYSWSSVVKVKSLIDNQTKSVYLLDNSSLEILTYKLNIKYVRDSLYNQERDSFVRLDCKVKVDSLQEWSDTSDS